MKRFSLTVLIAIAAMWGSHSAYSGNISIYDLVLTEQSDSILQISYNGPLGNSTFTAMNTSPDHWTIQINASNVTFGDFGFDWAEPEDPTNQSINEVSHSTDVNSDKLFVVSDLSIFHDAGGPVLPNNTAAPGIVGFDFNNPNSTGNIRLTFNDLASGPETGVPDTGKTFGLLAFSSLLLVSIRRSMFA